MTPLPGLQGSPIRCAFRVIDLDAKAHYKALSHEHGPPIQTREVELRNHYRIHTTLSTIVRVHETLPFQSMKRLSGKSKDKSRTWKMEAAQNKTPGVTPPAAPSSKTDKENLQEQTPHLSRISRGNRRNGESTLPPGSAVDGTEGIELGHNTPAIS